MERVTLLTLLNAFHLGVLFAKNKIFLVLFCFPCNNPPSVLKHCFQGFCKLPYEVFIDG